ncbi:hypothetical protein [Methylotuvimicrobium sp. KM1]|uniref:hypothetical protein n=1 Tax=Methylotuvimicrobium sp. KM1 TaxID=3377707 RepID=UPI00384BF081
MNLKRRRSPGDPNLTLALLQSGQLGKSGIYKLDDQKAAVGDFNRTAKTGLL